jgi:hypothetical protein
MSCDGSAFFIRMARYKPAGPPPMLTIFMARSPALPMSRGDTLDLK